MADIASLLTVLTQIALGGAAWRLANQLKVRVDDHELRLGKLEKL